jgi:hypothetical protein
MRQFLTVSVTPTPSKNLPLPLSLHPVANNLFLNLIFSGEFSADEEATICQVFTDLSGLLESQREGILIRIVKTPLNEGVYGAGTSFYLEDANGQGCGIGNNMVWEQMNTAVDYDGVLPYHTASGVLKINQTLPSPNYWHTLHDDLPDGQLSEHAVDLYTVVLHEALHILGFASRIQPDGLPVNGFYSRWDKLLYAHDEMPTMASTTIASFYKMTPIVIAVML